ncbi:MAG TPA: hypothetical protein VFO39_10955 [Candidatus Sulfotelmatobacter sp.]|nr:hypothetical protein [Candidatus Sulfotelmatobacter sp.]
MNPSTPVQDLAAHWRTARQLHPIYFQLAREFVIDVPPCPDLENGAETPGRETVEQAARWLDEMDNRIQVHQLRQFLQTSSLIDQEGLIALVQHYLARMPRTDAVRDKVDFLLVQYFSQVAPAPLNDEDVELGYVAQLLEPVLGAVELKTPVWLNALDRVREAARRCKSLDELLHGGLLEQGRKAKTQAGDLFFLPIALVAFTRFGYLMRRVFFRLMHGDLNVILDGLNELEDKGVRTLDCRRAQFSQTEPIARLRMICQSWKVMFQAEYSSGQPLRMLVDLRSSVEDALGGGKTSAANGPAKASGPAKANAASPAKPLAKAAAAAASGTAAGIKPAATEIPKGNAGKTGAEAPEFDVSGGTAWDPDSDSQGGKK